MYHFLNIALSLEAVPIYFQQYLGEPDARVKDWILLNSPLNLVGVYLLYATIILAGIRFMKNRKPFDLKNALIVYNCFQIAYSAFICKEIFVTAYMAGYKLSCTLLDMSSSELALRMARAFWYFYISKIVDLIDTIFFVLRKKNSQLTFLHVYHHTSMIINWYVGVLYLPGGQAFFSAGVNSSVHVIMYTYYLLSAMGPTMQKYLWWKKYLTQIQLVQFGLLLIQLGVGASNGCNKPRWLLYFTITYVWTLVLLFANFYRHAYKDKKSKSVRHLSVLHSKTLSVHDDIDLQAGGDMKLD